MTFQEFITKFNGKYIDFDGAFSAQCVDLIRFYLVEVLGISNNSIKPVVGAKDMFEKYDILVDKTKFDRIPNTPTGVPKEGDIVLWGATSGNPYGHVALFVEGDSNSFRSFDQNYPVGSPCHVQNHTYSNVLGWLNFIGQPPITDTLDECKTNLAKEIEKKNETYQELVEVRNDLEAANSEILSHKNFQTSLAVTLKCDNQPTAILGQITKLLAEEDQLRQTLADNQTLKLSEASLTAEMAQSKEQVQNLTLTNNAQAKSLEEAKDTIFQLNGELAQSNQEYQPLLELFGLIICKKKAG